jgi:hypothetical protein
LKDVYHISVLEDIKALPQGKHNSELSFKYEHGKAAMVLSSPKRDAMLAVSACLSAFSLSLSVTYIVSMILAPSL